jgi:hypothetical protein
VGEIIPLLGWMGSRRFMTKPFALAGVLTIDDPKHPSMFEEPHPAMRGSMAARHALSL